MRKILATLLIVFSLISTPALCADFKKGIIAAQSGDYETALHEFIPLAKQGHNLAQYYLAIMYQRGDGVPQDDKLAAIWMQLPAEKGYAPAQYNLGQMYFEGEGVARNYKAGINWWTLAAEQGYPPAQYNLGVVYLDGINTPKDSKSALKWFKMAAEQGFPEAQSNLGIMYAEGMGVPQNYVLAHMWTNIAMSNGYEIAGRARDELATMMTPSQLEKAQDLARDCVARNYKDC